MAMRSDKDFDLGREPNVFSADGEAGRARALNEENVVVGVDERGRNGATSSVDEKVDDDSDSEFRVSLGKSSAAPGSGLEENRVLSGEEGGVGVGVLGRDGVSTGNFGNDCVSEAPARRIANAELVVDVPNKNAFDFHEENSRMGNFGSMRDGAFDAYKLQKHGNADSDRKMAVVDGSGAVGVHPKIEASMKVGYGFEMGDMVWGKVKSHPWWPGHIFNEAFASPSVRRTKRDGHVLVAFFGDSSYGWFDPEELIPYEPHFAEKSQQTNSRNFVKAVEESVDEASRRSALGLSCRCRNPYNFRLTNVHGYLAVDVFDYEHYEPGGIYSVSQIKKARDSFQTGATLSFMKQLALSPMDVESRSIDFIKNKAIALAFRRAVFEEFDDTYAQAFGQEPVHPVRLLPSVTDQSIKDPTRGPLSGPLVMAEALGGQKSSIKATKSREQVRRDRYLFKRRDEPKDSRTAQAGQRHGSSSSSAYEDRPLDSAAEYYVFQRRHQSATVDGGQVLTPARNEGAASSIGADSSAASGGPSRMDGADLSGKGLLIGAIRGSEQYASGVSMSREECNRLGHTAFLDVGAEKKVKTAKRHTGKLTSEQSDLGQKKKRRMVDAEMNSGHYQKLSMSGSSIASAGKLLGKTIQIAAASKVASQLSHQKKDVECTSSLSEQVALMPSSGTAMNAVELPQLLGDLQALALNPFHGVQRNRPAILRLVFLRYRSLVFQKSAVASPSVTLESRSTAASPSVAPKSDEIQMINSAPVSGAPLVSASSENVRNMPPSKLPKPLGGRPDDPTKAGWKRIPSERPEDSAAKRVKKIVNLKSSGPEKRNIQKISEAQRADGKGMATPGPAPALSTALAPAPAPAPAPALSTAPAPPPPRTAKVKPLRRMEPPKRVEEPTYLMMKYPPGSSLPSSAELRARFIRFGPMDASGNRIFYKTNTCRVMFLYKEDAQKAYGFCVGNKSIYANVRFSLKPVQEPSDAPRVMQPSHPVQLKSILKKPAGDEAAPGARVARVRFDMDHESHVKGVHSMDHRNNSSFQDSGPSSVAMEVASSSQHLISQHPLPPPPHLLPPPPSLTARAPSIQQHSELGPRVNQIDAPPIQAPNVDIRQQMLTLLARCHDIVTNLVSAYGYIPYHPL